MSVIMGTEDATTGKDEAGKQGVRHSVLQPFRKEEELSLIGMRPE